MLNLDFHSRMKLLFVLVLAIFLISSTAFAFNLTEDEIAVNCEGVEDCSIYIEKIKSFSGKYNTERELVEKFKIFLLSFEILSFNYYLNTKEDGTLKLDIDLKLRKKISKITFNSNYEINFVSIRSIIPFKEKGYYSHDRKNESINLISKYLVEKGYEDNIIKLNVLDQGNAVVLEYNIVSQSVIFVDQIIINSSNKTFDKDIRVRFSKFKNKIWDKLSFKLEVDRLTSEMINDGFYEAKVKLYKIDIPGSNKASIRISIDYGEKYNFNFHGNKRLSHFDLLSEVKDIIKNNSNKFDKKVVIRELQKKYELLGLYDTKIEIQTLTGLDLGGLSFTNYYLTLHEGSRIPISKVSFRGNEILSGSYLLDLFYQKSSTLSSRNFLDKKFLYTFKNDIKKEYYKRGYIFVEILDPLVVTNIENKHVEVEFKLKEGHQTILKKVNTYTLPNEIREKLLKYLSNREGTPLNVSTIQNDLTIIIQKLHSWGYYYAKITNINEESLLNYNSNYNEAFFNIKISLEKKTKLNTVIITGNSITKLNVLKREVQLKQGDILTPTHLNQIKDRLASLGLFSKIQITPFIVDRDTESELYNIDLLIQVREKDFGLVEIAPGYRTDIGLKVSSAVTYNNLKGMNRSGTFKAEVNQRLDFDSLDLRRRREEKRILEYSLQSSFIEPYLFWPFFKKLEFDLSASYSKRRFFSFDAEILRGSIQFSKSFSNKVNTSIKYQIETIEQFDGTKAEDNGVFRIGGITPSISVDLRDSKINPRKGAFFGLSMELASPKFGSQNKPNIGKKIDFLKVISRNKVYIPFKNWGIALSAATGFQKNLAGDIRKDESDNFVDVLDENGAVTGVKETSGFIPSIKVFRLDGIDAVRGFSADEINLVDVPYGTSSVDIATVRVQDTAFFTNFKFEPRFYLSDSVTMGVFMDAGRVFLDTYRPFDLRTSVGASLKFITPVGSLDFDYGVKLHRESIGAGKESFGRFHLAIGFF
jgi:outer membrane protein insertion porin family